MTEPEAVRYKQIKIKKNPISLWNDRRRAEDEFTSERFLSKCNAFSPPMVFPCARRRSPTCADELNVLRMRGIEGEKKRLGDMSILILHHRDGGGDTFH